MSVTEDEEDPFWTVQLVGNAEARPFAFEAPVTDCQDHALPVGTKLTTQSLAGVLGCEREFTVPLRSEVCDACDDDTVGSGPAQALVLKLRQLNGDGVMSGVGGDVWCAALLLSAWLLENPEVVRDLDVLELGSGLGLCGIAAGYLAKSVTLTDYIDELLVNLHHNLGVNRVPWVTVVKRAQEAPEALSTKIEAANHGVVVAPRQQQQQKQQQQQQEQELTSKGSRNGAHHNPANSSDAPCGETHPRDGGQRPRGHQNSPACHSGLASGAALGRGGMQLPRKTPLLRPFSRVRVRKLDWTAYARGEVGRNGSGEAERVFWWDDRGSGDSGEGTPPSDSGRAGSDVLRCDVVVGSALIYSPHHACVADVLKHAFTDGGCRAAYVVQLSTRPGFDEFLRKLGSCGLRYRLQKISAALPTTLLDEIRRLSPAPVVGGPISHATHDHHGGVGDEDDDDGAGGVKGGAGFDEFVLCSISRAGGGQLAKGTSPEGAGGDSFNV